MILEDINAKFALVIEGYTSLDRKLDNKFDELNQKIEHNSFLIQALNRKIDHVDTSLSAKVDGVAADLKAHRTDTEVHRGYRVKED